jgi:hypothetical protein
MTGARSVGGGVRADALDEERPAGHGEGVDVGVVLVACRAGVDDLGFQSRRWLGESGHLEDRHEPTVRARSGQGGRADRACEGHPQEEEASGCALRPVPSPPILFPLGRVPGRVPLSTIEYDVERRVGPKARSKQLVQLPLLTLDHDQPARSPRHRLRPARSGAASRQPIFACRTGRGAGSPAGVPGTPGMSRGAGTWRGQPA